MGRPSTLYFFLFMNITDEKTLFEIGYQAGVNSVLAALQVKFFVDRKDWSGVGVLEEIFKELVKAYPKDIFKQE